MEQSSECDPEGADFILRPAGSAGEWAQIRAQQAHLLMGGAGLSIVTSLVVALVAAYVQQSVVEPTLVVGWLSATFIINGLRAALVLTYFKYRTKAVTTPWLHLFVGGTALAGAAWGLGAWLLYPPHAVAHQAFLGVLVAGLAAGAVTTLSASLSAALAFVCLALLPLAVRFLSSEEEVIFVLGLLTLLFLGITLLGVQRTNASIIQNMRLRLESATRLRALHRSEAQARKLAMVASRTDNAVVLTDSAGRVEWVNEGFKRITGYSLAEVLGRTPGSVLQGPGTDPEVVQRIRDKLRQGQGFEEEILNYTKDGRPYWLSLEVQPIRDAAGNLIQFMAIERDITELRLHQQQLEDAKRKAEAASQAKSKFLAMMSHEIRTPLNGVLGSLGLLQDTPLDGEQRQYVETSRRSAEWLLTIINDILDFSKMEAGKIQLEPGVFGIAALVESVVEMLQPRAAEKSISIRAEIDPAIPSLVEGDATKIRQVLVNLATNSVKFTPRGEVQLGVALIEGGEQRTRLRFSVIDTGVGIPENEQAKIFEEFWSRSLDCTHGTRGTGLGLSISHRLVTALGGEIAFESQLGEGSRFWFDIPLAPVSEAAAVGAGSHGAARPHIHPGERDRLKGRVLLAEDNPTNQLITQALLGRLGLTVDVVANGREAVDAVRRQPYDLVLMDIGMPELDGIEATRAIRALAEPARHIPIVAITAHVMRGEREQVLAQGLDDYLAKPIHQGALIACLTHWLGRETARTPPATSHSAAEPAAEAVIDRAVLAQLEEDVGEDTMRSVLEAFAQELRTQCDALDEATQTADLEAAAAAAHRLKGSAASFGALRLSGVVAKIEEAARNRQAEALGAGMDVFWALATETREALEVIRREFGGESGA